MSNQVKDRHGHVWDLTITLASAFHIDRTDFSLYTNEKVSLLHQTDSLDKTFSLLMTNNPLMFAVIFCVVEPQVKDLLGIDPVQERARAEEAFMDCIDGRTASDMRSSFWEMVADFFPENRTALLEAKQHLDDSLKKVDEKIREMSPRMREILDTQIDRGVEELKKKLDQELQRIAGTSSSV